MVYFVRAQMLGRIVLPSTLALPFHVALVFLRVSSAQFSHFLFFKAPNYMLARTLTERVV